MDASETFRAELERIGSISSNGSVKVPAPPPERPTLALSPPKAAAVPLQVGWFLGLLSGCYLIIK